MKQTPAVIFHRHSPGPALSYLLPLGFAIGASIPANFELYLARICPPILQETMISNGVLDGDKWQQPLKV